MVTIDLNINPKTKKVNIKDDILFNAILSKNKNLIKKLVKSVQYSYQISDAFFEIVNNFVDFTQDGTSMYGGLIVRTGIADYAVLYLEGTIVDEDYMIGLIDEYILDVGDYKPSEVEITKFSIRREIFINFLKKL